MRKFENVTVTVTVTVSSFIIIIIIIGSNTLPLTNIIAYIFITLGPWDSISMNFIIIIMCNFKIVSN